MKTRAKSNHLTTLCIAGAIGLLAAPLHAATIASLTDDFTADTIDAAKWNVEATDFEVGTGTFTADTTSNADQLTIAGTTTAQFWGGTTLESVDTFSSGLETTVSVDRVSLAGTGSAYRSSLWIYQDGGTYLHFSQNNGEGGWSYNPGNTGGGTNIGPFDVEDGNLGNVEMKLVITPLGGTNADVGIYLGGALGATHNFTNWDNSLDFHVRLSGIARANNDTVSAVFDNFSAVSVPEPSGALLALVGIAAFGFARRRR